MADNLVMGGLVMRKLLEALSKGAPVALLMLAAYGLTGCDSHSSGPTAAIVATKGSEPVAAPVDPLNTPSKAGDPAHFTTSGPLVAEQQADVATERDGRVIAISVQLGDHVRRGQMLANLDDRLLRATVASQTAKLDSLRAQVREWQSEQKMDEADLRRADQLLESKLLTQENWEHVKYKLDEVIAEVARYQADTVSAEADLSAAKLQLEQSQIVAPFSGVVGRSSLRLTQEVKKGDVAFWITAEAPLRILFTVPESVMSAYPPNGRLELTTADYPDLRQAARVLRVSPVIDPASDSVQVIGAIAHPSPLLKPGMSMQVTAGAGDADHR